MFIISCLRRIQDLIQYHTSTWKLKMKKMSPIDQTTFNEAANNFLVAGIIKPMLKSSKAFSIKLLHNSGAEQEILHFRLSKTKSTCLMLKYQGVMRTSVTRIDGRSERTCKLDWKDTYTMIHIHSHSRRYLTFKNKEKAYQHRI